MPNKASVDTLVDYFGKFMPLDDTDIALLHDKFQSQLFLKRQFALQNGQICGHFNFVVQGCLRLYKVDDKGNTHILQFATEHYWINDLSSFYKKTPSGLNIDALEDSVVLRITYDDLIDLYVKSPKFDRIFRVLLENHYMQQQDRIAQLFSSTAEERYQSFLEYYPHLTNRIPQVHIASYLGVTPEFLSRIRNRMVKNNPTS